MGALKQLILCSQVKKSSNLTLGSATYPFEGPGGQPKLEKLYILMMDFEHSIRNLFSCATNKCNMCESKHFQRATPTQLPRPLSQNLLVRDSPFRAKTI